MRMQERVRTSRSARGESVFGWDILAIAIAVFGGLAIWRVVGGVVGPIAALAFALAVRVVAEIAARRFRR
jgi:cytochrome b subunit of formate dehydrogenase